MTSKLATFDIIQEAPNFAWSAFSSTVGDPAQNGFTKNGTGTTQSDPQGWRITTLTTNAQTYYSLNNWPNAAFAQGFTLFVTPPIVDGSDGTALPNKSVIAAVDDGAHRFELTFNAQGVQLNGGTYHHHRFLPIRLAVAAGGATAALWVGTSGMETATPSIASAAAGLVFGDFATTDDSDAVWQSIAYGMSLSLDGVFSVVPSLTVKVYDVDDATVLSDLVDSDGDGYFPTPTISAAGGKLIRYGVENFQGMAAYAESRSA